MAKASKKKPKVKKVEFRLSAPEAQKVSVAGDFNQWDTSSHSLKKGAKGIWKIFLSLSIGHYEYRFFVDGEWRNDPNSISFRENPFGTLNCLKIVE